MRRGERSSDPAGELIKTIEIKNKEGRIVERKEVVSVKGLLHLAHNERLSKIDTEVVQTPAKDNGETAIVLVRICTSRGAFSGLGDANPRNVTARVALHFIRMAETRALARALRAALDIGAVAIEELEEEFGFAESRPEASGPQTRRSEPIGSDDRPRETEAPRNDPTGSRSNGYRAAHDRSSFDGAMSDAQRRLLYRLAFEHGHEGDEARTWLHQELGVESLTDATKRDASALIDRLVRKDNGNGHATTAG